MKNLAEILKAERKKRGWILRHAAAQLDIDQAIISKIEKGDRRPTREQIEKFAQVYNLNLDELLILWLSDKIVSDISYEKNPETILKVAEKAIKYNIQKK